MSDELHPELRQTADPSKVVEPHSTIDATRSFDSTLDRTPTSLSEVDGAPSIPGYDITGKLARGGMGVVYSAMDLTLKREVAIKTLLPGADPDRFIIESEITARLPHPGIPPVHALARLDDDSPFLVMKLIRGRTLADLLKERPSPSDDLSKFIAIFEQIAQAVGFAHEQGIIHRDLKPLNVMVGAFGEVQVMDWGLAKDLAIRERERPESVLDDADLSRTTAGAVMGTPGYMAPEQARGEPADARADVFALGAILATILTGKPAFVGTTAQETIEKAARGDLAETLKRLETSGADAELVALARECLAADSSQRPSDAKAVALRVADYRLGVEQRLKQAETAKAEALVREAEQSKRRRAMQWAGGIITAVLLAGVVGASLGWNESKRQEGIAKFEAREKDKALKASEANLKQAKTNLAFAKKGNEILGSVFAGLRPERIAESGRPLQDVLRMNLGIALKELDGAAIGDPLEVTSMQTTLGVSLITLGAFEQAVAVLEKAWKTRQEYLGVDHPETLNSLNNLAAAFKEAGDLKHAMTLFENALRRRTATLGPEHADTLTSLNNVAMIYVHAGKLNEALPVLEEVLGVQRTQLGSDDPITLKTMNNLASANQRVGKLNRAVPLYEEALNRRKATLGADHPETLQSMNNLALGYLDVGKAEEALPLLEEAFKIRKATLGADHPGTLQSMNNLALAYRRTRQFDQSLPLLEETVKLQRSKLGADHPDTLMAMNNLALNYQDLKKIDQALPLLEETLKRRREKLGADHPDTLMSLHNLAYGYEGAGKLDQALPLYEEVVKLRKAKLGVNHHATITSVNNLAMTYRDLKKSNQALPLFEEAAAGVESLRFQHPSAFTIVHNAAMAFEMARQYEKSESLRRKWMEVVKARSGTKSAAFASESAALGLCLLLQQKWSDAEVVINDALAVRQKLQPDAWSTFNTQSLLGAALLGRKKFAEAEPPLLKGYEGMKAREKSIPAPVKNQRLAEAVDRLVDLYTAINKPDEVRKWKVEQAKFSAAGRPKATEKK